MLPSAIMEIIQKRLGDRFADYLIPPPVFLAMQGEFIEFDLDSGMLAAAADNTIGPLSMLVSPPNVTRRLEMKYSRPVTSDLEYITVQGSLVGRKASQLNFSAEVRDPQGTLLARARATHWIVEDPLQPGD